VLQQDRDVHVALAVHPARGGAAEEIHSGNASLGLRRLSHAGFECSYVGHGSILKSSNLHEGVEGHEVFFGLFVIVVL
jgi:hypothetical protein